jgi:hypothetical protein
MTRSVALERSVFWEVVMKWTCFGLCVTFAWGQAACLKSSVETTQLNAPPRALTPRAPESIEVYSSAPPTRPHVDIALLRANLINYSDANTPKMVRSLLEEASKLGCDAIFISGSAERQGAFTDLQLLDVPSHGLLATCIAYSSGPAAPSAAVPPSNRPANAIVLVPQEPPAKPKTAAVVDNVSTGLPRR